MKPVSDFRKTKQVVCMIIPSLQAGGMERVMSELANYFAETKVAEFHIVLYGKGRRVFYPLSETINTHTPEWEFDNRKRTSHTIKTMFYIRKTIKSINPDTILSFGEYWNSFVLMSLLGTGYRLFIADRCSPEKDLGILHEWLRRWLYPGAAGIVAQTKTAQRIYVQKKLNKNIRVIGNPVREITEKNSPSENAGNTGIILSVGRLIDTKHHDRLIDMFKHVNPGGWKLIIAGGDAIKQNGMKRLQRKILEEDLTDSVELTGTVSDIDTLYRKSDIFAFTSSSEGFPNVIGEAMSAGLPIVSYDCVAGPGEMVEDGKNGYLVDLFDDQKFESRLRQLIENEDLRKKMGAKSKDLIKKYRRDKIADKYFEFITGRL